MSIDHVLQLYVANINTVVLWLALIVLGLIAFYLILTLRQDKLQFESAGGDFSRLEDTLKKVLETTQIGAVNRAAGAPLDGTAPAGMPNLEDLEKLRATLAAREVTIAQLEAEAKKAVNAGSSEEADALKKKLKDIEARFAEYEIIEDDIANLSIYRDENTKLKDEIERLKNNSSAPTAPSVAPAPIAPVVPEPVAVAAPAVSDIPNLAEEDARKEELDLMAEFEAAVKSQKNAPKPPVDDALVRQAMAENPEQDLMGDFQAAVAGGAQARTPDTAPAAVAAPAIEPPTQQSVAPLVEPPVQEMAQEPAPEPVQQVAEAIAPVEPPVAAPVTAVAQAPEETAAVPSALAEEIDTDKMLSELENVDISQEPDAGEDAGDKLIAEFEDFVKGSKE